MVVVGRLVSHQTGSTYVMIISQPDEMYNQLEESQVTMGTIKGSRYLSAIKVIKKSFCLLSFIRFFRIKLKIGIGN